MKVYIMRGLPGAGKSTFIKTLTGKIDICSADDFHMKNGVYSFDPKNIAAAHNQCLTDFLTGLEIYENQFDYTVIDNTNTSAWEIAPYYRLAEIFKQEVKIIRIHCDFETASARNIHGVPLEIIWRMNQNILTERLPAHWKEEIIFRQ